MAESSSGPYATELLDHRLAWSNIHYRSQNSIDVSRNRLASHQARRPIHSASGSPSIPRKAQLRHFDRPSSLVAGDSPAAQAGPTAADCRTPRCSRRRPPGPRHEWRSSAGWCDHSQRRIVQPTTSSSFPAQRRLAHVFAMICCDSDRSSRKCRSRSSHWRIRLITKITS